MSYFALDWKQRTTSCVMNACSTRGRGQLQRSHTSFFQLRRRHVCPSARPHSFAPALEDTIYSQRAQLQGGPSYLEMPWALMRNVLHSRKKFLKRNWTETHCWPHFFDIFASLSPPTNAKHVLKSLCRVDVPNLYATGARGSLVTSHHHVIEQPEFFLISSLFTFVHLKIRTGHRKQENGLQKLFVLALNVKLCKSHFKKQNNSNLVGVSHMHTHTNYEKIKKQWLLKYLPALSLCSLLRCFQKWRTRI